MSTKTPKTPKKPKKPLGKLEASVKKVVKGVLNGWKAYNFWPVQTGLGKRTLDCIACVPVRITADMVGKTMGCFVAIETKRESINIPTPMQAATMREMRAAGAVAVLVNSTHDLDVEDQILWAIRNSPAEGTNWISLASPYVRAGND